MAPIHFEPLYKAYYRRIHGYILLKTKDKTIAADITSETFCKAMIKINQYKTSKGDFYPWLFTIALNEIRMHFRNTQKENYLLEREAIIEHLEMETEIDNTDIMHQLDLVLENLSTENLELLELRFYQNLSFKEIGQILSISDANAKVKVYRILSKLKPQMKMEI